MIIACLFQIAFFQAQGSAILTEEVQIQLNILTCKMTTSSFLQNTLPSLSLLQQYFNPPIGLYI